MQARCASHTGSRGCRSTRCDHSILLSKVYLYHLAASCSCRDSSAAAHKHIASAHFRLCAQEELESKVAELQRASVTLKEQGRREARAQMLQEKARQGPRIIIPQGVSMSRGVNPGEMVLRMPPQGNVEIQWE